jgi:hypothetical protein
MAYPDYSIVVFERPNPQLPLQTISDSSLFTEVKEAKAFYALCQSQNWRCFLFEKPQPNLFHRNDSITVPTHLSQD